MRRPRVCRAFSSYNVTPGGSACAVTANRPAARSKNFLPSMGVFAFSWMRPTVFGDMSFFVECTLHGRWTASACQEFRGIRVFCYMSSRFVPAVHAMAVIRHEAAGTPGVPGTWRHRSSCATKAKLLSLLSMQVATDIQVL